MLKGRGRWALWVGGGDNHGLRGFHGWKKGDGGGGREGGNPILQSAAESLFSSGRGVSLSFDVAL